MRSIGPTRLRNQEKIPPFGEEESALSSNMKKCLAGKRFESNENGITKTEAYFEELPKYYYFFIKIITFLTA